MSDDLPVVPDDIKYLGDSMANVVHWTKKVYDALRRAESPNPSIIRLDPGVVFSDHTRMRVKELVFTGGTAASVFALRAGSANAHTWVGNAGPIYAPLPIVLEPGIDYSIVDVTTPGSTNWRAYLTAYVEQEYRDA